MRQFLLATVVALFLPAAVQAQMRLDVSGIGATLYPVAIADFAGDDANARAVVEVIRSDLARSGSFRIIDPGSSAVAGAHSGRPDYATIRARGADTVLTGSVSTTADGRHDLRYQLGDAVRQNVLGAESLIVSTGDLRFGGHRVADRVYELITGEKGIFSTRIAFVSKEDDGRFRLNVADWDGENVVWPLTSPEPIISPAWSPDGTRIAYVSFESRKPVVYVHTLATGTRVAVANFKGSNSAPAWSPDGRTLAVALTRDGLSQIYLINADGNGAPRRLTDSPGIDTEPSFAPDGKSLYFTSDRGGSPQIYRMPVDGGMATRITFGSSYNVSPRASPDGRLLAHVTRREGRFLIVVRDLASGRETILSETGREESPSFAPNSRWVMFATHTGIRDSLVAVTVDARVRQRLASASGDIREPTWGPFPQ